ncbi:hypothetical protein KI387_006616, partial [Taxus chinensis]
MLMKGEQKLHSPGSRHVKEEQERVLVSEVLIQTKEGEELENVELCSSTTAALKACKPNFALTEQEMQEDVHRLIMSGYFFFMDTCYCRHQRWRSPHLSAKSLDLVWEINREGHTALHLAVQNEKKDIRQCWVDFKDDKGDTTLDKLISTHHDLAQGGQGCMYLDLNVRKYKYPGCAHFAIKGFRRLSETEYQLPVVALICNFPLPARSSQELLNHWEVETLFHEFYHAIHSLLSCTDYQHFSGTRTVLEFTETLVNLFEYFAWDHRVLKQFAKHYSIGDVIPEELVLSMNKERKMFCSNRLAASCYYSYLY